jgi:hypothetical protein
MKLGLTSQTSANCNGLRFSLDGVERALAVLRRLQQAASWLIRSSCTRVTRFQASLLGNWPACPSGGVLPLKRPSKNPVYNQPVPVQIETRGPDQPFISVENSPYAQSRSFVVQRCRRLRSNHRSTAIGILFRDPSRACLQTACGTFSRKHVRAGTLLWLTVLSKPHLKLNRSLPALTMIRHQLHRGSPARRCAVMVFPPSLPPEATLPPPPALDDLGGFLLLGAVASITDVGGILPTKQNSLLSNLGR